MNAKYLLRLTTVLGIVAAAMISVQPVQAQPSPDGPDACIEGYIWREARPGDTVCVKPEVAGEIAIQNANPGANRDAASADGMACIPGVYVYREAFDGDRICVTPNFRQRMLEANANAQSRKQANAWTPAP